MKKINNPYNEREGHFCFGCSEHNQNGLQMEFFEEEDEVTAYWEPKKHFEGYKNVLHGGIQATLMDEIASWYIFAKMDTSGVTSKMDVKYKRPVLMDLGPIKLKAKLKEMMKNIANISVKLYDANDKLCSEADVYYFTFSKEEAKKKFAYPGKENFIERESD